MSIQRLLTEPFLEEAAANLVLDVRSPAEYLHARLPGALSLPLFSDEERKVVGTLYKQKSRQEAIKAGLDFFGPRMRKMVEETEGLYGEWAKERGITEQGVPTVYLYCWRGGMRSAAVAWLLDLYGFRVYTLVGGYKSFRNHVLRTFSLPFPLCILGGYTGSGKTGVLQELSRMGAPAIDLEKLAAHRGSAFGGFNMPPPPSQEQFENLLALELLEKSRMIREPEEAHVKATAAEKRVNAEQSDTTIAIQEPRVANKAGVLWLEDESQRIGNLNIPPALWARMRNAPLVFLEIPFEERLEHIMSDYGTCRPEKLIDSVKRISKRLGGLETKNTLEHLEAGRIKEAFRILLQYYDKRYLKGLHNRENVSALLTRIACPAVTPENAKLLI